MKAFRNASAAGLQDAVALASAARRDGERASYAGGGSDLLGMVKERITAPDVVVSLKTVAGQDQVEDTGGGVRIGGLITLDALSRHPLVRDRFAVLAEAAGTVATPQIRNVGTLSGNLCQRPWCWYYRNGFDCYKAGGNQCFSATGENQFHAIFGGGPSFIVHPSDTAVALVALGATFDVIGPGGNRSVPAADFFALPSADPARENVLGEDELLAGAALPAPGSGARSAYHKVMDREAWTHAVVSAAVVLDLDGDVCRRARIVLGGVAPTPWRVPDAEAVLVGQRVTPTVAARAAEVAVVGARPLAKNGYKVTLTQGVVERTLVELVRGGRA
jgi:xanthine dehydrogenase YagS FAD-binding subunit